MTEESIEQKCSETIKGLIEKYKDDELTKGIKFVSVEHIDEVLLLVFDK